MQSQPATAAEAVHTDMRPRPSSPSMTMATGQMLFHRVKACNEGLTLSTARMSSAATGLADLRM